MSKRVILAVSIILALAILVACGGSSGSGTTNSGSSSTETSGSGSSGTGSSGSGSPVQERSRIVNFGNSTPSQLDPQNFRNFTDELAIRFSYEPIIYSPRDGSGYQPSLAESWDISPDGLSWTFYLREGVLWSNGDPFSADDILYSVERVVNNSSDLAFKNQYMPTLKDAEKIDDYTVKINFTEPTPFAGNGFRAFYIIPKKVHEQYGDSMFYDQGKDYFMIGTGPWLTDEWIDGQYIHYFKNPIYWNKANFDSYFEEVYTRQISEPSTGVSAHIVGDLDIYVNIPLDYVQLYAGTEDTIEVRYVPSNSWNWFAFRFNEGSMWHDKDVRDAFDMALDRQAIIDNLYGGVAATIPFGYFGHPSMDGYDESFGPPVYDPERARELLANSSYDGRTFELLVTGTSTAYEQLAMVIMDMLVSVGFHVEVTLEQVANFQARVAAGDYDVFLNAGSFPDGVVQRQITKILVDSDKTMYQNEELLSYIRNYLSEVDAVKREEYAWLTNKFITEEKAPHITLQFKSIINAQRYGITGVEYYADGL